MFEKHLLQMPLVDVYDNILIPALAMAETHWQLGELNDSKHHFILQSLKDMIQYHGESLQHVVVNADINKEHLVERETSEDNVATELQKLSILCLPARTEADEITAMMLAQILGNSGNRVQVIEVTSLAVEIADLVEQHKPDLICLSATPPAAAMHAQYLCKRLRDRLPEMGLVVGLWGVQSDLNKARERIGFNAIVVAKLADAQEQIHLLSERRLPPHPKGASCVIH